METMTLHPTKTNTVRKAIGTPLSSTNLSDDEFFDFCQENDSLKFERDEKGNIIVMPNTGGETGIKNSEITTELTIWNRIERSGKVFDSSTAFRLPTSAVRSPDASWVSNERWNSLTENEKTKFPPLCPDFVVELMSENDNLKDARTKMQEQWIESGCRLGWLINPTTETVYIYRENGEVQIVEGFDKKLSGENVLQGFELDLKILK